MSQTEVVKSSYVYREATQEDNADILELLRKNPIQMEMDYIMDRHGDFFKLLSVLPGSRVFLARDREKGTLEGIFSMLKSKGKIGGQTEDFQYISDLIKSGENRNPMLMKRLLNYGLENYFDTSFIFGLVNARNARARLFSTSTQLQYPGAHIGTFHYFEMAPLWRQHIPKQYTVKLAKNESDIDLAVSFINEYYRHHVLFNPLSTESIQRQFELLPGFGLHDICLLYDQDRLTGAMITFRPALLSELIISRIDNTSRYLFTAIRWLHRITGLLFDPPREGGHIKTMQIRYLAGDELARKALLKTANNTAYKEKMHSVSMLLDARDPLKPDNLVVYRYQSLMYANGKGNVAEKMAQLKQNIIFFDIIMG